MQLRGGRIVLALGALVFAGFGALYWIMPVEMAAKVGVHLDSAGAIVDVQGLYGGLELGLGLFLGYCALAVDRTRLGLLAGALALSGIAISRAVAIARFGSPGASVAALVGLDAFGAVLNIWFWHRYRAPVDAARDPGV